MSHYTDLEDDDEKNNITRLDNPKDMGNNVTKLDSFQNSAIYSYYSKFR